MDEMDEMDEMDKLTLKKTFHWLIDPIGENVPVHIQRNLLRFIDALCYLMPSKVQMDACMSFVNKNKPYSHVQQKTTMITWIDNFIKNIPDLVDENRRVSLDIIENSIHVPPVPSSSTIPSIPSISSIQDYKFIFTKPPSPKAPKPPIPIQLTPIPPTSKSSLALGTPASYRMPVNKKHKKSLVRLQQSAQKISNRSI